MKKNNGVFFYYIISVLLPLILLVAVFVALRITPFGNNTLLFGDSNSYYINYLSYLRTAFSGEHSFYYSFSKGIGGSIAHLSSFFLLRPDFLLYVIAGTDYMPEAFSLGVILVTSFAGLTMYILLSNIVGDNLYNLIFSTSYALMGFLTVNNYIIVFTMGPVLLPLVVLGIRKIIKGKNIIIYCLSLGYSIACHFQMGFILCCASVIFFTLELVVKKYNMKEDEALHMFLFKGVIFKYSIASIIGGFIGAVVWLPALLSMIGGRITQSGLTDFEMIENAPVLQMGARFFSGAASTSQLVNGFPAVFCGVIPLFLTVVFFRNKSNKNYEKTVAAITLGIYIVSFYIKGINNIFQGFGHVNWFNFRQSFVFTFVILVIASIQFSRIGNVEVSELRVSGIIILISTVVIFSQSYEFISGGYVVADLLILLIVVLVITFHKLTPDRADYKSLVLMLILLTCLQMYLNYFFSVRKVIKDWGISEEEFTMDITKRLPIVNGIKDVDKEFYRMEIENQRTGQSGNDPMMFDYDGVGHTSYEKDFVNANMSKLGIGWFGIQSNYYDKGISASMDSFLGLRYLISERDLSIEKNYEPLGEVLGSWVYRNPYALPIAISSNDMITNVSLEKEEDIFKLQNEIWSSLVGEKKTLFTREEAYSVKIHNPKDSILMTSDEALWLYEDMNKAYGITQKDDDSELDANGADSIDDKEPLLDLAGNEVYPNASYLEILFEAAMDGPVYMYDSSAIVEGQGSSEDVLKYLGNYKKGDMVTGRIYYSYEIDRLILAQTVKGLYIYYADMDALAECSSFIQSKNVSINKDSDTYISGIAETGDNERLLLTIPYDSGWKLYVDGIETKIEMTMDLLMSAKLPTGVHSYELKYTAPGFYVGLYLSIISLIALTIIEIIEKKKKRERLGK